MSRRLEQWVAEVSRRFLALPGEELDAGFRTALAEAAGLTGADRAHLLFDAAGADGGFVSWAADGVEALPARPAPEVLEQMRWAKPRAARGELVHLACLDDLPPEAEAERCEAERRGARSVLGFSVLSADRMVGYLCFERVRRAAAWPPDEVRVLRLLAEIFASAVERRRTEQALRESEMRFRALAEHATELISEFGPDGNYLYASPSFKDLLGYEPEHLIGTNPRRLIHPDDLEASRTSLVEAYESQGYSRAVHRLRHADGTWRWFDNTGRAFRTASGEPRFVSIGRDITERKRMEDALERQLEFESRVADLSRRLLALSDADIDAWLREGLALAGDFAGAEYAYLWPIEPRPPYLARGFEWFADGVDPARAAIAPGDGRTYPWSVGRIARGELIRLPESEALPPEAASEREDLERRGVQSLVGIPLRSGETTIGYVGFERMRARGDWSDHEVTWLRVFGDLFGTALRRKRDAVALRESQAQLLQSQKMEAVGQLAGGVAHDFNNLLMVILGNAQMLLERLGDDAEAREDAEEIRAAAGRAASLTRQLLTFSRREILEPRGVDLNEVVGEAADMLSRLLGEDVDLHLACDPRIGPVLGDPGLLEQVLVNLAVNARDAMPEGGRLHVSTGRANVSREDARRLGLPSAGRYVSLAVADTGAGMDEETCARAFEPFFTTKEPGKGTGLGLSIVYSIAQRSGGTVQVRSRAGAGTTFRVYLPETSAVETAGTPQERPRGAVGSETVLVVEDEISVRRIVRNVLRRAGYRVLEAGDGEEALVMAAAAREPLHLLLTDVVMPRMGGGELARRLVAARPELRVLFVSGYPEPRGADIGELPPASGFLAKPFTDEALLAKVRQILDGASPPA